MNFYLNQLREKQKLGANTPFNKKNAITILR